MNEWITPAIISLIVTGIIQIAGSQLQARNNRRQTKVGRDEAVANRYYDELRKDIEKLKVQWIDAEHRADKWQTQYYQLYAKYQIVKSQYELAAKNISQLERSLIELKNIINSKEQTS